MMSYILEKKKKKITKSIESRYYKPKKFINWRKSKYNYQQSIIKTHNKRFEECRFKQNYFDFIYS